MSMRIKKGDQVTVNTGKDKGKTGEILEINRRLKKIKVKSISMIKRHLKPTKENKGGIISKERIIHQSKVKNIELKKRSGNTRRCHRNGATACRPPRKFKKRGNSRNIKKKTQKTVSYTQLRANATARAVV